MAQGKITEADVIRGTYNYLSGKKHKVACPNVYLFNWESDLISLSSVEMIYEFEVKLTVADFQKDFEKEKHLHLSGTGTTVVMDGTERHYLDGNVPSKFYYVMPYEMVNPEEVPEYAGILYYDYHDKSDKHIVDLHREAQELHRRPATPDQYKRIARSLSRKYKKNVIRNKAPWV